MEQQSLNTLQLGCICQLYHTLYRQSRLHVRREIVIQIQYTQCPVTSSTVSSTEKSFATDLVLDIELWACHNLATEIDVFVIKSCLQKETFTVLRDMSFTLTWKTTLSLCRDLVTPLDKQRPTALDYSGEVSLSTVGIWLCFIVYFLLLQKVPSTLEMTITPDFVKKVDFWLKTMLYLSLYMFLSDFCYMHIPSLIYIHLFLLS